MRTEIFRYVKEQYGIEPDYPFPTDPSIPVLRHPDNRKWFALIMDVPGEKLSPALTGRPDVVNLKIGDPLLVDLLVRQPGFFRAYHMNHEKWISVLLDGTVPFPEICRWIDESYGVTALRRKGGKAKLSVF